MAVEDDESMMSTAYDELIALYSRVARRTDDVEGAQGLARDTFALREKLVAAAPEQAWAQGRCTSERGRSALVTRMASVRE
jgi:hypothetical protein